MLKMELLILLLFVCVLFVCVLTDTSVVYALTVGYFLFSFYAYIKGHSIKSILKMSSVGILKVKNILITFILIGMITALWRASGTIPSVVYYSSAIITPQWFLPLAFLLNCLVSVLTGTAFGTAATMGSICMTMANTFGINPVLAGGAVLAGSFFGDRCSPVSTSALLVSELTNTDIYSNIKNMLKTAVVPFILSLIIYSLCGFATQFSDGDIGSVRDLFTAQFEINIITVLPAVLILVLAAAKINVKINMLVSIALSALICFFVQHVSVADIIEFAVFGFKSSDPSCASMLDGGGIFSMLRVAAIVCISSCYSGIFEATNLLDPARKLIDAAKKRFSPYTVTLLTSIIAAVVACNQALAIMLTHQLCEKIEKERSKMAIFLENSAVVVAPLIPWSIAGNVPLTSSGAPTQSIFAAFFLYLLPIYSIFLFRNNFNLTAKYNR